MVPRMVVMSHACDDVENRGNDNQQAEYNLLHGDDEH